MDNARDEVKRLMRKIEVKDANEMDNSEEWNKVFQIMSEHGASREDVDAYREHYKQTALSLLKEPLSDIPRGRMIQFLNIFENELNKYKESFRLFRNQKVDISALMEQYDKFSSVLSYFSDFLVENGDHETDYIPGLDETDAYKNNKPIDIGESELSEHYEAVEHAFACYECLAEYARNAIENTDSALMNAVSFNMDVLDLYINGIMEFIENENENEKASDI